MHWRAHRIRFQIILKTNNCVCVLSCLSCVVHGFRVGVRGVVYVVCRAQCLRLCACCCVCVVLCKVFAFMCVSWCVCIVVSVVFAFMRVLLCLCFVVHGFWICVRAVCYLWFPRLCAYSCVCVVLSMITCHCCMGTSRPQDLHGHRVISRQRLVLFVQSLLVQTFVKHKCNSKQTHHNCTHMRLFYPTPDVTHWLNRFLPHVHANIDGCTCVFIWVCTQTITPQLRSWCLENPLGTYRGKIIKVSWIDPGQHRGFWRPFLVHWNLNSQ